MKPYGLQYFKHTKCLRSTTKTARLIAKNADRSTKKAIRRKLKIDTNLNLQ